MPSKTQGRQRPSLKDTAQACSAQREWCSTGRSQRKRQKNGRGNDPPAGSGTLCPGSSQGTDNTPLLSTDEVGEPGKPDRQGMPSCCRPGSVCRTSGTREAIGEDCRSGQKEVRKRPGRGTEEAREPVGTRQDRTLLPVPDALRTTFRKRDFRAFAREHVSTDRRNRHSGALPGNMSEGLRKKKPAMRSGPGSA